MYFVITVVLCRQISLKVATIVALIAIELNALFWTILPFFDLGATYKPEVFNLSCGLDLQSSLTYMVPLLVFNFVVPVLIMLVSYMTMCVQMCRIVGSRAPQDNRERMDIYFLKVISNTTTTVPIT